MLPSKDRERPLLLEIPFDAVRCAANVRVQDVTEQPDSPDMCANLATESMIFALARL
jgi:hypothetical protein